MVDGIVAFARSLAVIGARTRFIGRRLSRSDVFRHKPGSVSLKTTGCSRATEETVTTSSTMYPRTLWLRSRSYRLPGRGEWSF